MDDSSLALLRHLLIDVRVLTLAIDVKGDRVVGVLPFLADPDLRSLLVHTSRLAKHTRGLTAGASFSAALHEADHADADPLALPRLLFAGTVELTSDAESRRIESLWTDRFPSAVMTIGLGDFEFRRLRITNGRLVAGFAQAFAIGPRQLDLAAALGEA